MLHLQGAVGPGCPNNVTDVRVIQALLNRAGAITQPNMMPLAVDGAPGPKTFAAIQQFEEFELQKCSASAAQIDPWGATLRKLSEVADEFQLVVATVAGEAGNSS